MNQHVRLATDTRARFTAAEFVRMASTGAFDDMKVELIGGELERMNPPMNDHASGQAGMVFRLAMSVGIDRVRGEVGIALMEDTVVACDVALLHAPVIEDRLLIPADLALVVEVAATTLERDMGVKRMLYATAGIPTYWVVDVRRAVVHVYREPVEGDYASVATVRFGEPLPVPDTDATITLA